MSAPRLETEFRTYSYEGKRFQIIKHRKEAWKLEIWFQDTALSSGYTTAKDAIDYAMAEIDKRK